MNTRHVQRVLFGLALGAGGVTLLAFEKLIGIFVVLAALYFVFSQVDHPERKARDNELRKAQQAYDAAVARWREADPSRRFAFHREALARLKSQLDGLQTKRLARMRALRGSALDAALKTFLQGYDIRHASIEGIGPARVTILESNGIETAADVSRAAILAIPGFGPQLTARLERWRDGIAARFTPPASGAMDAQALARLEAELAAEAAPLIAKLSAGPAALAAIASRAADDHSRYVREVEVAARAVAKAQADFDALRRR